MLARVLAWIEDFDALTLRAKDVDAALTPSERRALAASGVLREGADATTLPCEEHGDCAREVRANEPRANGPRANGSRARLPFVAVCTREPAECAARDVGREEIAQTVVDADALVRAIATLAGVGDVRPPSARPPAARPNEPARLGRLAGDAACELFFVRRPDASLAAFLESRDRAGAATRVLVPTPRRLSPSVALRGDVVALSEALAVERGALALHGVARAPHLRVVASAPAPAPTSLPAVERWEDLAFCLLDNHTVRVRAGGRVTRRAYADFGMASAKNQKPIKAWALFVAFLEGRGVFRGRGFGKPEVVTRLVSTLRAALKRAFRTDADPIADYAGSVGWVARFKVEDENPEA